MLLRDLMVRNAAVKDIESLRAELQRKLDRALKEAEQAQGEVDRASQVARAKVDAVRHIREEISSVEKVRQLLEGKPTKAPPSAAGPSGPPISVMSNEDAVVAIIRIASPAGGLSVTQMAAELGRVGHKLAKRSAPVAAISDVISRLKKTKPGLLVKGADGRYTTSG